MRFVVATPDVALATKAADNVLWLLLVALVVLLIFGWFSKRALRHEE